MLTYKQYNIDVTEKIVLTDKLTDRQIGTCTCTTFSYVDICLRFTN